MKNDLLTKGVDVVCVNPDWANNVVKKRAVITANGGIAQIRYDLEKLSHIQHINYGDYLINASLNLTTGVVSTTFAVMTGGKGTVVSVIPNHNDLKRFIEYVSDFERMLFSDFEDYTDLSYLERTKVKVKDVKKYLKDILWYIGAAGDTEMMEFITTELANSHVENLPLDWDKASPVPKVMNVRERLTTDNDGNTVMHQSEHWLLIHRDGTSSFPDLAPTKGAHINLATGRTLKVYNDPPHPIPDDVDYAVRIALGVEIDNGTASGVAWTIYRNPKAKGSPKSIR